MTFGEIIARVMRNINFVYNDTDHIKNLINEALVSIASDAKIQTMVTYTLVPGQSEYPLPANYKEPITLIEGELGCIDREYTLTDVSAYNSGYYTYDGNLVFRPTPNDVKTVKMYYYQYPDYLYNEDEIPDIDPRYHDVLASYAAAMILSLPSMPEVNSTLIDRYFGIWEQRKADFKVVMQRKSKQTSVRRVTNYD